MMADKEYHAFNDRIQEARTAEDADALRDELRARADAGESDARDLLQKLVMTRTARGI